mgnify:CR=1 FL=1
MADAKIINYGQPIGAGTTVIPDNQVALDIESTDAKEYIQIDTTDSSEKLLLAGGGAKVGIVESDPKAPLDIVTSNGDLVTPSGASSYANIHLTPNGGSALLGITCGANNGSSHVDTVQGALYFQTSGTYGSKLYLNTSASFGAGAQTRFFIDNLGAIATGGETSPLCIAGGIHLQTASDSISPDPTIVLVNGTASDDAKKRKCTIEFRGVGDSQAEHDLIKLEGHAIGGNNQGGNFDIMNNTGSGGFNITGHFDYNNTVGLGSWVANTTPSATVHIRRGGASLRLDNTAGADTAAARLAKLEFFGLRSGDEAVEQGQIHFAHEGTADDDKSYMVIETNDGTSSAERLRIDSAGKVGIGTTAAAAMLEAKGNLGTQGAGTIESISTATVTGSGSAFLTKFALGSAIKFTNDAGGTEIRTVLSVASNTELVLTETPGATGAGRGTKTYFHDPDLFVVKTGDNKDKFTIDAEMSGQVKLVSQSSGTEAALEIYDEANQVVRLSKVKSSYAALTWENGQELKFRTHTGVDVFNLGGTVVQAYKDVKLGSNADLALSSNHSGSTGGSVLIIENGSGAPSGALSNAIQLYSASGELVVMDAGGNTTTLSPHNFSLVERSEPMAWSMYSANAFVGKEINVDMLRVVRKLEELTGESFVSMRDLPEGECLDWDTEEQRHYDERQQRITEWESLSDDEKENTSAPESYAKKDKPSWLS